jgi:hypothetical protein
MDAAENAVPEMGLDAPMTLALLEGVVARGHRFRMRAGGGSMFPFIRDGDVLSIAPLAGSPGIGDVLAFKRCPGGGMGQLVVHRLVGRTPYGCLLRGDSYPPGHSDGQISPEALLGRVERVERTGRPVRLGLGPERFLIAALSRLGLLWILLQAALRLYRYAPRRHV